MASNPYSIRVPEDELAQLREDAAKQEIELSKVFRLGARMYLDAGDASQMVAERRAGLSRAATEMERGAEKARAILRGLDQGGE